MNETIKLVPGEKLKRNDLVCIGKDGKAYKAKPCSYLSHEWESLTRKGRCSWICPKCGEDVMLILVLLHEAGISIKDLKKIKNRKKRVLLCPKCEVPLSSENYWCTKCCRIYSTSYRYFAAVAEETFRRPPFL